MATSFVCLLALVAGAAAYGTPEPPRCYSKHLDKYFSQGEKWMELNCQQAECIKGEVTLHGCEKVPTEDPIRPTARCRQVDGAVGSEFPGCCPTAVCDRCYSTELARVFDDGAVWTEDGCTKVTCVKGDITKVSCDQVTLTPGCRLEAGPAGAQYPECCAKPVCPRPDQCYYEPLGKVFDNGAVWTQSGCTQATCNNGEISTQQCETLSGKAGCTVRDGTSGADFPTCCPQEDCPVPEPVPHY